MRHKDFKGKKANFRFVKYMVSHGIKVSHGWSQKRIS